MSTTCFTRAGNDDYNSRRPFRISSRWPFIVTLLLVTLPFLQHCGHDMHGVSGAKEGRRVIRSGNLRALQHREMQWSREEGRVQGTKRLRLHAFRCHLLMARGPHRAIWATCFQMSSGPQAAGREGGKDWGSSRFWIRGPASGATLQVQRLRCDYFPTASQLAWRWRQKRRALQHRPHRARCSGAPATHQVFCQLAARVYNSQASWTPDVSRPPLPGPGRLMTRPQEGWLLSRTGCSHLCLGCL